MARRRTDIVKLFRQQSIRPHMISSYIHNATECLLHLAHQVVSFTVDVGILSVRRQMCVYHGLHNYFNATPCNQPLCYKQTQLQSLLKIKSLNSRTKWRWKISVWSRYPAVSSRSRGWLEEILLRLTAHCSPQPTTASSDGGDESGPLALWLSLSRHRWRREMPVTSPTPPAAAAAAAASAIYL